MPEASFARGLGLFGKIQKLFAIYASVGLSVL